MDKHIENENPLDFVGGSSAKQYAFGQELTALINKYSLENDSNTQDIVLSTYLLSCLKAFNHSVNSRGHLLDLKDVYRNVKKG